MTILAPGWSIKGGPVYFKPGPTWAWHANQDATSPTYGDQWVEMTDVLECGHRIRAVSHVSNEQLRRNLDRVESRHRCDHPGGTP